MHAGVQMSGWQEVRSTTKDDWKSITAEFGEQSAIITSTTVMLSLSAIVLDSSSYWFDIIPFSDHCAHVLTATPHSYENFCDFLLFPQSTWKSDPSTDFHPEWLIRRRFAQGWYFCSKNGNFFKPLTPGPENREDLAHYRRKSPIVNFHLFICHALTWWEMWMQQSIKYWGAQRHLGTIHST